jgi:uncharacterized protein with PIN domain
VTGTVYLDTSALLAVVFAEPDGEGVARAMAEAASKGWELGSSQLVEVEAHRAALRAALSAGEEDYDRAPVDLALGVLRRFEIDAAVSRARDGGASWTVIGVALGVSRQAALKRYGAGRGAPLPTAGA